MPVNDLREVRNLLMDKSFNFCGAAFWTWKKVANGKHPPLIEIRPDPDWLSFIRNKEKISPFRAKKIMSDYLKSVRIQNNVGNPEMKNNIKY